MSDLDSIRQLISDQTQLMHNNHTKVCERLTAVETTMKNNHDAYGDIPRRVDKLEGQMKWLKGAGYVIGTAATAVAGWFGIHFHKGL